MPIAAHCCSLMRPTSCALVVLHVLETTCVPTPSSSSLVESQVELLDVVIGQQAFRRAVHDDLAAFHDVAGGGDAQGHHGVLFDEQDAHALVVEFLDDVSDLLNQQRGQTQ